MPTYILNSPIRVLCCHSGQFTWPEFYSEAGIQLRSGEWGELLCYKYAALSCGTQSGDARVASMETPWL